MNSTFKRYIYKNGLDIVAPLKCGTRWLEGLDIDIRINRISFNVSELSSHIHSGTTFIWRPVREHFYSALKTELSISYTEKSPFDIVTEIESGICDHWYPHLYKELYPIWSKTPFRFYKLRALSLLTPSASELYYNPSLYTFLNTTQWDDIDSILSTLSPKHLIRLERLIVDEEKWLKSMLQPQYNNRTWEEYLDLEDSLLEMKIRVKDMEMEISRITDSEWVKGFQTIIKQLKKSNAELEAKVEYSESVFGKLPTKLI